METFLLKSFDENNQYLDTLSGKILTIDSTNNFFGWYVNFDNLISKLFVNNHNIYFAYGNWETIINESCSVKLEKSKNGNRILEIYNNNLLIKNINYTIDLSLLGVSPFEYIDEEDFDWGVFILNIVNNKARKKSFIEYFTK